MLYINIQLKSAAVCIHTAYVNLFGSQFQFTTIHALMLAKILKQKIYYNRGF